MAYHIHFAKVTKDDEDDIFNCDFDSEGVRLATSAHRSSKRWSNTGEISAKMAFNVLTCLDLKDCLKLCLESK